MEAYESKQTRQESEITKALMDYGLNRLGDLYPIFTPGSDDEDAKDAKKPLLILKTYIPIFTWSTPFYRVTN